MRPNSSILLFFTAVWISRVDSLNVLFYVNAIGKSHLDFSDSLIDSLAERGHTVDLIIARMNDKVTGNGRSQAERIFTFGFKNESGWGNTAHLVDPFKEKPFSFDSFRQYTVIGNKLCEIALTDDNLFRFISERKYDIGIVSTFDFCGSGMLVKSGIPSVVTFNAIPILPIQAVVIGLPNTQAVPLFYSLDLNTFSGRFWNTLLWGYINIIQIPQLRREQTELFRRKYGKEFEMEEVTSKIDLAFINSNEVMEKPRPLHHRIQYIGGINLRKPKPLDHHFEDQISRPSNGTIIFSFGTQIPGKVYPRYAVKNFIKVFKKFPGRTFLWKYEVQKDEEKMFEEATNVFPVDWLPQTDLLYDPRVIGFISHAGLNSFNEASYAGKPMLAIPLFADQPHNAQNGVARGTTVVLNKEELTEESIEAGLRAILFQTSYTENAQKLQKMLVEKPSQPKERFVKWMEFAAVNPGLHKTFELPGARMSIFEYYCVDAVLSIVAIMVLSVMVSFKLAKTVTSSIIFLKKVKTT